MGNICSTSQKNCKDAESEMSEGGGSDGEYKSPTKEKDEEKVLSKIADNVNTPDNNTVSPKIDTNEFAHHPNCDENEKINKINAGSGKNTSSIFGKLSQHNKKIVLYIILSNKNDYEKQFCIINRFLPELSTHVRAKGFELTVSFTHHEILSKHKNCHSLKNDSNEDPLRHHEFENHLNEINRHKNSYIIPVIFFGNTLEHPHCPIKIEQKDFSFLLSITSKDQSDLLQQFYKADRPSQPFTSYSLNSHSSLKEEETEQILETFITLMPINLKTTYLATPVEKVITDVVLKSKDMIKHCIWIQDENSPKSWEPDSAIIKSEVSSRHSNLNCQLRDEIPAKNIIPPFSSSAEDEEIFDLLGDVLKSNIDSVIHEHLVKYNSRNTHGVCKPIVDEIDAVRRHSIAIGANLDSPYDLEGILKYIRSDSIHPLAVFSSSEKEGDVFGSQVVLNLEKWMEDSFLVLRYAQLTVVSSEITSLLASIADQISTVVAGKPCHTQHSILNYKNTIEQLLESSNLSIIIVIDSIDKVFGAEDLDWLPKISKPNAKIILSIASNGNPTNCLFAKELIKRGVPKDNLLPLLRKTSSNNEKNAISHLDPNCFETKLNSKLLSFGVEMESNDIEKLTETLLCTLESKIDVKFLEILLVIIAISPYGLYETDCINIFEEQAKVEKVCSLGIWSRFCWLMGPMLTHTNNVKIINSVLKSAVLKRYSEIDLQIKTTIKRYYENQPDLFFDAEKNLKSLNEEKYSKVPQYDLAILSATEENIIEQYFTKYYFKDLSWISNKITSSGCFQYLHDIIIAEEKYKKALPDGFQHITLLKLFLTQHMMQLNYDGSQFYTLFKVFLKNLTAKDESLNSNEFIKHWTATFDQINITYFESLINDNDNQENITKETKSYNEVVILKEPGHFVAAISTNCDEICVWDVHNCKKIRVLKSVPQPSLLCSIRNLEVAVLCKREIKVIDLEEGEYKATLKGVMNQKMPYFGLHDEDHLVCLSRNRMYVNLMNLKTGDCATSFKAGEDRFLNSLIVSGNGRILVCGDESQKPFSLLVWHLSQRRLLYDLRIPHHDLFTALSAITYEGLYVSVVAKEIKEPGPNFIVVYDLQSGTLFQKLKPACNTVAIAISQANGCVIAGLENADILIWDLVTGNCRYTLTGHSAPATLMKLDPLGRCLLSGDKDGRDLSLRLWELSTGKSLAVYTPPHRTSSCEVLDNGLFTIIAMEEAPDILILQLKNYDKTKTPAENCIQKSVDCKIHILKEN